jgi:hypothetical protein
MTHINEKTSNHLEIILKSLELFEKASYHFKKPFNSIENVFKIFEKTSISLKISLKSPKIVQNASH